MPNICSRFYLTSFLTFRDRFRTTVNVLGDCFGVGIVQCYSRKQLGPRPTDVISIQPDTTEAPPTKDDRSGANSPLYGSSNGAVSLSPTASLVHHVDFNPTLLHGSGEVADHRVDSSHQLVGGPDSATSTDKDETKL